MKQFFDIELLPEAVAFLESLDDKTRIKIYYNLKKAQYVNDSEIFKKHTETIWESRTLYNNRRTGYFLFGTKGTGHGSLQLMAF